VTPSTKPEVHNVSQRRQTRDRATATINMHEKLVKSGRVVAELCEQTDRQTYSSQYFTIKILIQLRMPERQKDLNATYSKHFSQTGCFTQELMEVDIISVTCCYIIAYIACRIYATSITSVCPSVTLVDYDNIVQQIVELDL